MGVTEDGILGERLLFAYLKTKKQTNFFQPDVIYIMDGKYYIAECKHQQIFKAPPYDGHGLPLWQIKARLKFQEETGIRVCLYVFEKPFFETELLFWQFLDILEHKEHFDTHGNNPRRIYKIESYIREYNNKLNLKDLKTSVN